MAKQRPKDILERRLTARPRFVKPRKQRNPAKAFPQDYVKPTRAMLVHCNRIDDPGTGRPLLVFERDQPECAWFVPAVSVPMYYFDEMMLKKRLVISKGRDTFTVTGSDRVFKLVAREQVHRTKWKRYLVVELRSDLPHNGLP
jgi:hypothetical protein